MNKAQSKLKIIPGLLTPLLLAMLLACPVGSIYGKDKEDSPKTKHSSTSKKKKGKSSKNKGLTVKVEKDPASTGPFEDVSNLTEVSQDPSQASGKGKSKKGKN
jgi:hypothetical protein